MQTVTDLPAHLDLRLHPLNTHELRFEWDSDLAGRTFELQIDAADLLPEDTSPLDGVVDEDEDTITVTIPAATPSGRPRAWALVETTAADTILIGGKINWSLDYDDEASSTTVAVTAGETSVVVVTAGPTLGFLDGGTP